MTNLFWTAGSHLSDLSVTQHQLVISPVHPKLGYLNEFNLNASVTFRITLFSKPEKNLAHRRTLWCVKIWVRDFFFGIKINKGDK